jgi:hypothetical protein
LLVLGGRQGIAVAGTPFADTLRATCQRGPGHSGGLECLCRWATAGAHPPEPAAAPRLNRTDPIAGYSLEPEFLEFVELIRCDDDVVNPWRPSSRRQHRDAGAASDRR